MEADPSQRLRELSFLERIVRATAEEPLHADLLRRIIDEATEATGAQVCSLYLWSESERVLILVATNGLTQSAVGQVRLELGEGVTGWVAAQGQPLAVRDVRYESRFEWVPGIDQERFISMLSVPIKSRGRVLGVINLQTEQARIFTDAEIEFAQTIAAHVAGILRMAAAHEQTSVELAVERSSLAQLLALHGGDSRFARMLEQDFLGPLAEAQRAASRLASQAGSIQGGDCRDLASQLRELESRVKRLIGLLSAEAA
ncbi:MAG TPA: GAF domain-containing protein [Chloroflexota bacterium]